MKNIRNFSIIAHIDHGKSTLADRFLQLTHTIEVRRFHDQMLDMMDLEQERGITIKMQPVRMVYTYNGSEYLFNLIDTPGHIDFSYEVSRALAACEGALLLVDASQGVQAQTLSHLTTAQKLGLKIIPVINKIDLPHADVPRTLAELQHLGFAESEVLQVSGKSGVGVAELLQAVIEHIPAPTLTEQKLRALVFDSEYSEHGGVIAYVRLFGGSVRPRERLQFFATESVFEAKDVGFFAPVKTTTKELESGMIGYVVTGLKFPDAVRIGDTLVTQGERQVTALPGYREPSPVVWASFFPEDQKDFFSLGDALSRLRLNDSSLSYKESGTAFLGRGYACGFLGTLHLEIVAERLKREFELDFIVTAPSVAYRITHGGVVTELSAPHLYPKKGDADLVEEPMIAVELILPEEHLSGIYKLQEQFELTIEKTNLFGPGRLVVIGSMPLRAFVRDFFETLHRVTSWYASISYTDAGWRVADLRRIDVQVAGEPVEALARVVHPEQVEREARQLVEALKSALPREQFEVRIQALTEGRIIASERITPMKKDVTGHLYGGDRTRKMKLWAKQKKGKARMKATGKVSIPTETFLKLLRK